MRGVVKSVLVLGMLMLVGCGYRPKGEERKGNDVIDVDMENLSSPSFLDYFSGLEIIPLRTEEEALVQSIGGQLWHDDKLYILDEKQKKVFVFDQKGNFIKVIDRYGSGPGEYADLVDLQLNRFTGDLELLNPMGGILVYDSLGDVYKKTVKLPPTVAAAHYFVSVSSDVYLYFCAARDGNKMVVYDAQRDEVISELYDRPSFIYFNTLYCHSYTPFYLFDDKIHFVQAYNGDVFTYENGNLSFAYPWNFGKYNFDIANLVDDKDIPYYMEHYKTVGSRYATMFIAYVENARYYISQFNFQEKMCTLIYDKENGCTRVFHSFKEGHRLIPTHIDESAVWLLAEPRVLPIVLNREELNGSNLCVYDSIDMESNPVILKYIFK